METAEIDVRIPQTSQTHYRFACMGLIKIQQNCEWGDITRQTWRHLDHKLPTEIRNLISSFVGSYERLTMKELTRINTQRYCFATNIRCYLAHLNWYNTFG